MGGAGSRYSDEFKAEAVGQVVERGYKVAEVAERLQVSTHSLYKWLKADPRNPKATAADEKRRDVETENVRLKAELRRVEEERDVLRKAAAYSANQSE